MFWVTYLLSASILLDHARHHDPLATNGLISSDGKSVQRRITCPPRSGSRPGRGVIHWWRHVASTRLCNQPMTNGRSNHHDSPWLTIVACDNTQQSSTILYMKQVDPIGASAVAEKPGEGEICWWDWLHLGSKTWWLSNQAWSKENDGYPAFEISEIIISLPPKHQLWSTGNNNSTLLSWSWSPSMMITLL